MVIRKLMRFSCLVAGELGWAGLEVTPARLCYVNEGKYVIGQGSEVNDDVTQWSPSLFKIFRMIDKLLPTLFMRTVCCLLSAVFLASSGVRDRDRRFLSKANVQE